MDRTLTGHYTKIALPGELRPALPRRDSATFAVEIRLRNVAVSQRSAPNDPHTTHLHGLDVPAAHDAVPETSVAAVPANVKNLSAGNVVVYMFGPNLPGTYMYQYHHEASIHVQMGMYGTLVVHNPTDPAYLNGGPGKGFGGNPYGYESSKKVGFVFQFPSLLPSLTVVENVSLPTLFSPNGAGPGTDAHARELLDRVGLAPKAGVYPRQLSAGQQQRVVIARALFNRPQVLLADEPTSDLDEQTEQEIMQLFAQIHAQTGVTVVLVTHTTQLITYGTRGVRMAEGQILPAPQGEGPRGP